MLILNSNTVKKQSINNWMPDNAFWSTVSNKISCPRLRTPGNLQLTNNITGGTFLGISSLVLSASLFLQWKLR